MISSQSLLGEDGGFAGLIEASAIEAHECTRILRKNFAKTGMPVIRELIASRERHKALVEQITDRLTITFTTERERENIERLSAALCKIPKAVQKFAERVLLAPEFMDGVDFSSSVGLLEQAAQTVVTMIKELRSDVDSELIRTRAGQLETIHEDARERLLNLLQLVYKRREEAVKTLYLKDAVDLLEKALDRCRDVSEVIIGMLAAEPR